MEYTSKEILLKNGKTCLLRRPEEADAELGQIAAESNITGATIDFSTLFPKGGS